MRRNLPLALDLLGLEEKGFQRHRADRGNWVGGRLIGTNHGVSARAFKRYFGRTPTVADMRSLTIEQAHELYQDAYWDTMLCDRMPSGLDLALFDFGVNSGPQQAIRSLQRTLGVRADGLIGGVTMDHIKSADLKPLIDRYADRRMSFLRRLHNWWSFGDGWTKRVARITEAAKNLVDKHEHSGSHPSPSGPDLRGLRALAPSA